jgi:hypothetical protein
MNGDDQFILSYLQKYPLCFVSSMEICKRAAGKKRFTEDPEWARPILQRLTQQRVLEVDALGYYRLKAVSDDEEDDRHFTPRPDDVISEGAAAQDRSDDLPLIPEKGK